MLLRENGSKSHEGVGTGVGTGVVTGVGQATAEWEVTGCGQ